MMTEVLQRGDICELVHGETQEVCQFSTNTIGNIRAVYAGYSGEVHEFTYRDAINYPEMVMLVRIRNPVMSDNHIFITNVADAPIQGLHPRLLSEINLKKRGELLSLLERAGL